MPRYTEEFRKAIIEKMLPPNATTVSELSKETSISTQTLYTWRRNTLGEMVLLPLAVMIPHTWSDEAKLAIGHL